MEQSPDALPRRTTVGAWVDLQLCSITKRRREAAEKDKKTPASIDSGGSSTLRTPAPEGAGVSINSGTSMLAAEISKRDSVVGVSRTSSAVSVSKVDDATLAKRHERALGEPARKAPAPEAVLQEVPTTPIVLVDIEGTQSRDRGSADGVEFDSR